MKGLLIKDFKLMKMQKRFFSLVVVVAIGMAVFGEADSLSSFLISYVTFIGSLFTLSTINYDEFDNGNAFLFSLPVSRRDYVREKYGFGVIVAGCSWLFSLAAAAVIGAARHILSFDMIAISLMIFPCVLFILAVMLPVQLKFGGEKGRIVMFGVMGIIIIIGGIARNVEQAWDVGMDSVAVYLASVNTGAMIAAAVAVSAAALFLSYRISVRIMNRKEF